MYIFLTAITIDSRLCSNEQQWQQTSGDTICSPYDYQNLITLMAVVCNIVMSLIYVVNNQ